MRNEDVYYDRAYQEMQRLGIDDYIFYLKLCKIQEIKKNKEYSDKEIMRILNYQDMIKYYYDMKKAKQIKYNIIQYSHKLCDFHAMYDFIKKILV